MVTLTWTPSESKLSDAAGHGQEAFLGVSMRPKLRDKADHLTAELDMAESFRGPFTVGPVILRVRVYFPQMRERGALAGAPIGNAHDYVDTVGAALARAGVIHAGQVSTTIATSHHDPKHQRVDVDIEPWKGPSDDGG